MRRATPSGLQSSHILQEHRKNNKAQKNHAYAFHICRAWNDGSHTMTTKPMKTLELHYPMIQHLIRAVIINQIFSIARDWFKRVR